MPVAVHRRPRGRRRRSRRRAPGCARPARRRGRRSPSHRRAQAASSTAGVPCAMRPVVEGRARSAGHATSSRRGEPIGVRRAGTSAAPRPAANQAALTRRQREHERRAPMAASPAPAPGASRPRPASASLRAPRCSSPRGPRPRRGRSAEGVVVDPDVAAPPAVGDRRAAADVAPRARSGPPVEWTSASAAASQSGICVGEARRHARASSAKSRSAAARGEHHSDRTGRRPRRRRRRASASSIAPSRSPTPQPPPETSTILPPGGKPERARAPHSARGGWENSGTREAVHRVDVGLSAGDPAHLLFRFRDE